MGTVIFCCTYLYLDVRSNVLRVPYDVDFLCLGSRTLTSSESLSSSVDDTSTSATPLSATPLAGVVATTGPNNSNDIPFLIP